MGPQGIFPTQRFLHSIVCLMPRDEPILPKTWYEQDDSESERLASKLLAKQKKDIYRHTVSYIIQLYNLDPFVRYIFINP